MVLFSFGVLVERDRRAMEMFVVFGARGGMIWIRGTRRILFIYPI